jgi:hypothetical protein
MTRKIIVVAVFLIPFLVSAQEVKLNCGGNMEMTSLPSGKVDNSPATAFVSIDTDSKKFSISGVVLISTALDENFKNFYFIDDGKEYKFQYRYKNNQMDTLSSMTINRYSGQLEISNYISQSTGFTMASIKMKCEVLNAKKF